ncbi:MAG: hypothetical protein EHM13_11590, partial [Acidobacteria bacterium]
MRHQGQSVPYLVALGDTKLSARQGLSGQDLALEGYRIKTAGNVLLLVGSHTGPHGNVALDCSRHAAVALLERHLGFRWLWPGELGEVVSHSSTVRIAAVDEQDAPAIQKRTLRNFGMARPEGYRKAVRLMDLAEKFSLPVVTLIDTAGAYPGIGAEERGQAEAIARSTDRCVSLGVPLVAVVIGVSDRILMMEYATYSVISPEGCASILWRDQAQAATAAAQLKITAAD